MGPLGRPAIIVILAGYRAACVAKFVPLPHALHTHMLSPHTRRDTLPLWNSRGLTYGGEARLGSLVAGGRA